MTTNELSVTELVVEHMKAQLQKIIDFLKREYSNKTTIQYCDDFKVIPFSNDNDKDSLSCNGTVLIYPFGKFNLHFLYSLKMKTKTNPPSSHKEPSKELLSESLSVHLENLNDESYIQKISYGYHKKCSILIQLPNCKYVRLYKIM